MGVTALELETASVTVVGGGKSSLEEETMKTVSVSMYR